MMGMYNISCHNLRKHLCNNLAQILIGEVMGSGRCGSFFSLQLVIKRCSGQGEDLQKSKNLWKCSYIKGAGNNNVLKKKQSNWI